MLIDDDDLFTFLFGEYMKECDLETAVKQINHGLLAMKYLEEAAENKASFPDIIFLDLSMPVMDGWEFIDEFSKLLSKTGRFVPLYIVSSSISPYDIERSRTLSVVKDFIIKPASAAQIISLVKNAIMHY